MLGRNPHPGLTTPHYTMPSYLAQFVESQAGASRLPTAPARSQLASLGGARTGRGTAAPAPVLTPLVMYQATLATPPNWPGWIAVAKDATRFAIREWISHSWIRKEDTSINGSILQIKRGALRSSVDFGPTIHDALTGAGAPADVASAFGGEVWSAWKEWFQNFSMTVPEAFPPFLLWVGTYAPDIAWSAALTSDLRRGWSPGESEIRNLFPTLRGHCGAAAQEPGGSEAIQDYVSWLPCNFNTWKMGAKIGTLKGGGPVPAYNPPYVPAAPVVDGKAYSEGPALVGRDF